MTTIIIGLILIVIIVFAMVVATKRLVRSLKGFGRAARVMLKQPGAQEAYDILTDAARDGEITDATIDEAIEVMQKNGASNDDIIQFIQYVCTDIGLRAERAYKRLEARNSAEKLGKDIGKILDL